MPHTDSRWDAWIVKERGRCRGEIRRPLHHPRPSEAEVVLAGTAHDDVVQDTHADVLEGLHDLVGGVDVLFGRVALSAGMVVHEDDAAGMIDAGFPDKPAAYTTVALPRSILVVAPVAWVYGAGEDPRSFSLRTVHWVLQ